jgi:hypothetical protein
MLYRVLERFKPGAAPGIYRRPVRTSVEAAQAIAPEL